MPSLDMFFWDVGSGRIRIEWWLIGRKIFPVNLVSSEFFGAERARLP
jgi:hypothetical protein